MINITNKTNTLRKAIAQATLVVSKQETIDAIVNKSVPKGDVFEMAKTAGLFAVKKTSDVIPDCHPIPIEFTQISYSTENLKITITIEVHTIYKTGVEVEAMHGASVIALTMYDMLKPIDKGIEIQSIKLLKKEGGKSDKFLNFSSPITSAIIVCSDSVFAKQKEDLSGNIILEYFSKLNISNKEFIIVPDEINAIQETIKSLLKNNIQLIVLTGGTGVSARDITPEAVRPLLEKELDGVMEIARNYGQKQMPFAMLSRGVAGIIQKSLILTLPGSIGGVRESLDVLFPSVLHVFKILNNEAH